MPTRSRLTSWVSSLSLLFRALKSTPVCSATSLRTASGPLETMKSPGLRPEIASSTRRPNCNPLINQKIHGLVAVIQPAIKHVSRTIFLDLPCDRHFPSEYLEVAHDRLVDRFNADAHELVHGMGRQVVRSERGTVIVPGPLVVRVESPAEQIPDQAHLGLCQRDDKGSFRIGYISDSECFPGLFDLDAG